MSKTSANISQIGKYLNGELDAKAMHRLERQALDDPFLAEALEGYQKAGADQHANLTELSARLQQRVAKEEGARVVPLMRYVAAAASVLIIFSAGIWWYSRDNNKPQTPSAKQIALNTEKQKPQADTMAVSRPAPKPTQLVVQNQPKTAKANQQPRSSAPVSAASNEALVETNAQAPVQDNKADKEMHSLREVVIAKPASADKKVSQQPADTTPLNEMIVMGYNSSKKTGDTVPAAKKSKTFKSSLMRSDSVPQQRLAAQAPGVKVYPDLEHKANLNQAIEEGKIASIPSNQPQSNRLILGKVISLNDGSPVKGASVQVIGTTQVARTDSHGFFKVKADTTRGNLLVTNNGYKTKQVNANSKDSVKTIVLQPDDSDDLSEDIATGFTSQTKNADDLYYFAHPVKGWSSYHDYLKTSAVSSDGATGLVKVSFMVDKYGNISSIKIVKGLTDAANKKAISLLKDGPDWIGNSSKKPEKVTLRIKFSK